MSARKKAQEELTKEMIIQEANRQFSLNDFHKVSMRAIAKELDCSHGAIYYHFTNKSELFYAVVEQYFEQINTILDNTLMSDKNADQKIIEVFLNFMEFGLNHQSQYEFMFMMKDKEIDPLTQQASNNSYVKFVETLQSISITPLPLVAIYSTFIALHGFVSHFIGRVKHYEEVQEAAIHFAHYLKKALDNY